MSTTCGYACVSSSVIPRTDQEALKRTKAYQKIADVSKRLGIPPDDIYVDLITSKYRKRKHLARIPEHYDCVVIAELNALGTTHEEIKENYLMLFQKKVGLRIESEDAGLSTAGFDNHIFPELLTEGTPERIKDALQKIDTIPVKTNKGTAFKEKPEHFEEVYWLYENYFLSERDAYKNRYFEMGKVRFHRLADAYEGSGKPYAEEEKRQDALYGISGKPKRNGVVPEEFGMLMEKVENGEPLSLALHGLSIRPMTDITYKRYVLKFRGGKKAMAQSSEERKTSLARNLTKDIIL